MLVVNSVLLPEHLLILEAALPAQLELSYPRQELPPLPRVMFVVQDLGATLELAFALHVLKDIFYPTQP